MATAPIMVEPAVLDDAEQLVPLAMSRPAQAEAAARFLLLDPTRSVRTQTFCHHALGIVLRDRGEGAASIRVLRGGLRIAEKHGMDERAADIGATLGTALMRAGRVSDAVAATDLALTRSRGEATARIRMLRGAVHQFAGDTAAALTDYGAALRSLRRRGDVVWTARTLVNRGLLLYELGHHARADADLRAAQELYRDADRPYDAAIVAHNRADLARRTGDLPAALSHIERAVAGYATAGIELAEVHADRSAIFLAAGLATEAADAAEVALRLLPPDSGTALRRAMLLQHASDAARAAGDPDTARRHAAEARSTYRRIGNTREAARAELAEVRARSEAGARDARLLRNAAALATGTELGAADRLEACLIAARTAVARGDTAAAVATLRAASRSGSRGTALLRARGRLAAALAAQARGRTREVLRACEDGLTVLDEHRQTLGATEMRAAATTHGRELAELAVRHALATGDAATLLHWSERWRATAWALPAVRPDDDGELATELGALREVTRRIAAARAEGATVTALERERDRLERAARERTRRTRGSTLPGPYGGPLDPEQLRRLLGPRVLVELVDVDGVLHAVVVDATGVRHHIAGTTATAADEVAHLRFALHRLARPVGARGAALAAATAAGLDAAAASLQAQLLGSAADDLAAGAPVVVVPPGRLHAVPWGLLPALTGRDVSVAPSAAVWALTASRVPVGTAVALVRGPGLGTGGAEVPPLTRVWPDALHLHGADATADGVRAAIDGVALAHVAAHGEFRADNPMFSSLVMADGPLTVHDLARLTRAPHRIVLSACESGLGAPTGADELLGLVSALVPLGTAGVLASVVPVNDEATVPLMLRVHDRLRAGGTLGEGMRDAREAAGDEPVARATAAAFLPLGAG